jgi:hypothetical protein
VRLLTAGVFFFGAVFIRLRSGRCWLR